MYINDKIVNMITSLEKTYNGKARGLLEEFYDKLRFRSQIRNRRK